ncbi:hypothetical protein K450DRAFT_243151 [Umbelopsis ramanniana AG]|uniref:Glutamine synthetase n=1 Tax=Umbelopsis ramanniana AG TaxID=1314678 RepID=A0AAD5HCL3_UMBRA|nr:uncharacterized protein K450DRAFT_243151 [Umbelopsis ramanniana AG]KAI8579182.1 hypothetical protein K450DRAFT_243151 [Umbelopsis ramanniana AG]
MATTQEKLISNITKELDNDAKVKVAAVDIDGVLRGKVMQKSKFLSILKDGFGFCSVIFGWDIHDKVYMTGVEFSDEDSGFSDLVAKVDLNSFRRIPWENNLAFFLVELFHPKTLDPLYCCPRSTLRQVTKKLEEDGLTAYCGVEFEFFNFKETPESLVEKNYVGLTPLTQGMFGYSLLRPTQNQQFYDEAYDLLRDFKVDIEGWHTETGPGVFEAALAYNNAMESADRAVLFKTSIKQLAINHGFIASFMAKPWNDLPGCSGHIHFSLKDTDGNNVFVPEDKSSKDGMSQTMKHFVAGILLGLPSILAVLAPTVNSYKRLVENYWAPVTVSWGIDNRLGAIRVIIPPSCSKSATRIEMRVSGADINAHLAIAAVLACGHWGIRNKKEIPIAPIGGDAAADNATGTRLARTLQEAYEQMSQPDSVARQVLGDSFVDHYAKVKQHEWRLWQTAVTDFETKRYLELI